MGFVVDSQKGKGGDNGGGVGCSWGFQNLIRRKQVDSDNVRPEGQQLARELSVSQLVAVGVGATIGAGVYVLVGTVAREHSGPSLTISFLIAGIAAALSGLCYAELSSRCPSAGSAYHYSYICVGEGVAWLIGWALLMEYTIGGSAVARGISPNLALLFGGENSLPAFLAHVHIPGLGVVADPCAAILVLVVTGLLCVGIKESTMVQTIVTTTNACVMLFVIIAGGYLGFKTGWAGYQIPSGFFPFGINGMVAGSGTVFFAYIGFDSVASTAEEVKNPQRDLPLGIGLTLSLCCILYMLVSFVIVGLVPFYAMDPDTPISSAFASHGMQWAVYIITAGAVTALCSTLMGSLLPLPRIMMAMARDGLLPSFFSDVNKHTQVPIKSTIVAGICAATLAFFMDVSQLAGMVSVGTLLAFTTVAVSILILRYVPPDEVPLSSSLQNSIDSGSLQYRNISQEVTGNNPEDSIDTCKGNQHLHGEEEASVVYSLIVKAIGQDIDKLDDQKRRKIAAWNITFVCVGILLLTSAASAEYLSSFPRFTVCGVGGALILCGLIVLSWIDQDNARHSFGRTGGFLCPFVPVLPICSILINVYLLINLGLGTWFRVSSWLLVGIIFYLFYGRTHSSLHDAVYVPIAHADKIDHYSSEDVA